MSTTKLHLLTVFAILGLSAASALASEATISASPNISQAQAAPNEKPDRDVTHPNTVSAEVLGRGGLYSLDYDRMFLKRLAVGAGVSFLYLGGSGTGGSSTLIPVYANGYILTGEHRPFVTAGVDIAMAASGLNTFNNENASTVFGVFGAGYEYRGHQGFLFRATPYLMAFHGAPAGWFGMSFGYTF